MVAVVDYGGVLRAECRSCRLTYCLTCGEKANAAVSHEEGAGCLPLEKMGVSIIRRQLLDLLYTRCPGCQAVFFDFEGCFAITCDHCGASFCGFCLELGQSSDATHRHVQRCSANTNGDYYGDIGIFHRLARARNRKRVIEFLQSMTDKSVARALLNDVKLDLAQYQVSITALDVFGNEA